ncbi:sugar ABC transporter permease [Cognatishimia sp. SS12]|uniref:carbohydrate ABC transporter permease n=1 Tax=Cognatishimia sp. SS12 TaxID=2979465 RepID=UPI00232D1C4E|nr:sugar ABC transporter permease [Cognatishimia sp. SS12]MDC0739605.1 sugar ABC transporter permease [Cognatishimia sp. SS12]
MNARYTPWLFLMPAIVIYGFFGAIPILQTFYISMTDQVGVAGAGNFVGLTNYIELFQDEYFLNSLKNTGIWVACFLVIPNTLAVIIALLVKRTFWGASIIKTVFFLPLALSFAIVGVIWAWIYEPDVGLLDQLLIGLGLDVLIVEWLGPHAGNFSVIAAAAWRQTAFATVIYLAGLSAIPQELIEAAKVDGATRRQVFFRITLPLLKPANTIAVSSALIQALLATEIVLTMTRGGPFGMTEVVGYRMYMETFWNYKFGYGAAIGVVVTIMTATMVVPYVRRMAKAMEREWS